MPCSSLSSCLCDAACRDAVSGLRVKLDFESMLRLGLRLRKVACCVERARGASVSVMRGGLLSEVGSGEIST